MRDQLAILQKLQSVEGQRELAEQAEATLKEHGLYEQVVEALKDKRKS